MKTELTDLEVKALYYSVDQPHLVRGDLKAALHRAARKMEEEMRKRRRQKIYKAGQLAAQMPNPWSTQPELDGDPLGSLESMQWYRGFNSVANVRRDPYATAN